VGNLWITPRQFDGLPSAAMGCFAAPVVTPIPVRTMGETTGTLNSSNAKGAPILAEPGMGVQMSGVEAR